MTFDLYQEITDRMIAKLEAGTVPWHKPWKLSIPGSDEFIRLGMPLSMGGSQNKPYPYRGINTWLLIMAAHDEGYTSSYWGTFKKIKELGGQVRKGEKSTMIVFWKRLRVADKSEGAKPGATKVIPMLRYYRVFNANQADGLPDRFYAQPEPEPETPEPAEPTTEPETIPAAEAVWSEYIDRSGITVSHDEPNRAFYRDSANLINLPPDSAYDSAAEGYSTKFHEATHSTGNEKRCNRPGITEFDHFGSQKYAKEELCAEMGAAFLCGITGVDGVFDNSASYVDNWLGKLRHDKKLVVNAAQQASKAADYIQGIEYQADADNGSENSSEPEAELDRAA